MLEAHEIVRHFTEVIITPERAELPESAEFRHAKERFKADGRYKCRVCGVIENLQVHHFGAKWS